MTYNATGKRIRSENLAGQVTTTAWDGWSVTYNGENRPVRWTQGDTVITMSFDRMGRRVTKNDQRFVYNGYLQVANYHLSSTNYHLFVWDPTEPVATRPLVWQRGTSVAYYTHDGNKNVSEVIASNTDVAAHYEYAPFGALTVSRGASAEANPFRFSSEYAEDDTATVYYNYRHYEPVMGRWMQRDPLLVLDDWPLYSYILNSPLVNYDRLGLIKRTLKDCVLTVNISLHYTVDENTPVWEDVDHDGFLDPRIDKVHHNTGPWSKYKKQFWEIALVQLVKKYFEDLSLTCYDSLMGRGMKLREDDYNSIFCNHLTW